MSEGKVITIIQEKGGVGKSLATMNIAYYLSRSGKVLVIDLDGQAADITYYMLGNTIENKRKNILTILDVFKEKATVEEAILPIQLNLDIIPANIDISNIGQTEKISTFKGFIKKLQTIYDYIMIDVSPTPGWAHLLALSAPNQRIIPIINADAASLKALISLNVTVKDVLESINPTAKYLGIIVNRYDGRTNISKEIVSHASDIAKQINTSLFKTKIRQSVVLSEQTVSHKSIFEYAPNSPAAKDYEKIGAEIVERIKAEERR